MLRLSLFGAPRLERDGQAITLRRSKALALLAYLAVSGQPQERDTLLALLWPEFDGASARNNLRRELSLLRGLVGADLISTSGQQVALAPEGEVWVDLAAFASLLEAARRLDPASAAWAEAVGAAADLAADDFLAGFSLPDSPAFEEWQFFQREGLRQQLAEALEALAGWHRERRDYPPAIAAARRRLALDPLHEAARRALIELYARTGQLAAALRCYDEGVRLLASELGAEPEAATVALYEAIRARQLAPDPAPPAPQALAPAPAPAPPADDLPPPLTSFVGRRRELAELAGRLGDPACRLLTIVGPGGIGKTRLASEFAARHGDALAHGALFVSLAGAAAPAHIPGAIARALGLPLGGEGDPWARLADLLRGREQLLVLDNFEQLLDGAPQLAGLLRAAPRLRLLVTSREALKLQEEYLYPIGGLDLPDTPAAGAAAAASAVQLFVARALQARGAPPSAAEQGAIARICAMVGGMPLAIELAAAWAATLSCDEIAAELGRGLGFLETSLRNVPARHRSIDAVFAQTWARLDPEAARALMALSAFPAGFTREAAAAVAGATPATLARLLDHALLRRDADGRYRFHELVRQDAARRLGADDAEQARVRAACGQYYVRLLLEVQALAGRGEEHAAIASFEAERENVRGVWPAVLAHAAGEPLGQMLQGLEAYYIARGPYHEGVELLEAAEARLRAAGADREAQHILAHVLTKLGFLHIRMGDIARASARFAESGALLGALGLPPLPGDATDPDIGEGIIALIRGDYTAASRYAGRLLARSEANGLVANSAYAWYLLTEAALAQRLLPAARRNAARALAAAREARCEWFSAYIHNQLGQIAIALGQLDEADEHFSASYAIREAFGDPEGMARAILGQGESAGRRGEHARAVALYGRALLLFEQVGDRGGMASALVGLGEAQAALGHAALAWGQLRVALELAVALDSHHAMLDILTHRARLLLAAGRAEEALELLAPALLHPASRGETSERAQAIVLSCEQTMPAAAFDAALERGRGQPLDALVARLLLDDEPAAEGAATPPPAARPRP